MVIMLRSGIFRTHSMQVVGGASVTGRCMRTTSLAGQLGICKSVRNWNQSWAPVNLAPHGQSLEIGICSVILIYIPVCNSVEHGLIFHACLQDDDMGAASHAKALGPLPSLLNLASVQCSC